MSRIGKLPIALPAGVSVKVDNNVITVKGPKGELSQKFHSDLTVKVEDNHIVVTRHGRPNGRIKFIQVGEDLGM